MHVCASYTPVCVHSYRVPTISSNLGFDLLNYNIAITLYEKNQDVLYFIKMYMATIKLSLLKESVSGGWNHMLFD